MLLSFIFNLQILLTDTTCGLNNCPVSTKCVPCFYYVNSDIDSRGDGRRDDENKLFYSM